MACCLNRTHTTVTGQELSMFIPVRLNWMCLSLSSFHQTNNIECSVFHGLDSGLIKPIQDNWVLLLNNMKWKMKNCDVVLNDHHTLNQLMNVIHVVQLTCAFFFAVVALNLVEFTKEKRMLYWMVVDKYNWFKPAM